MTALTFTRRAVARPDATLTDIASWFLLAVACLGFGPVPIFMVLLAPAILTIFRNRFGKIVTSPVWLVTLIINATALIGYLLYGHGDVQSPYASDLVLSDGTAVPTLRIMCLSTAALAIGALATSSKEVKSQAWHTVTVDASRRGGLLVASFLPFLLFIPSAHTLWIRSDYLGTTIGDPIVTAAVQFGSGAVALLGFLLVADRTGGRRILIVGLTVAYFLIFLALGSRRFALLPLLFALGAFAARPDRTGSRRLLYAAVAAFLLLPIPLHLRTLPSHGLRTYLPHAMEAYQSTGVYQSAVYNLSFSFPLTGRTVSGHDFPLHNLFIEANPLPGHMSGWYGIFQSMRISEFVPFSGLGELAVPGIPFMICAWIFIGLVVGGLGRRCATHLARGEQFAALSLIGFTSLFAVFITQYNTRAATRLLYYAIVVDLLFTIAASTRRKPTVEPPTGRQGRPLSRSGSPARRY